MKAKRTFIVLAIVVAVLALGIAYAATLGNSLNVSGTATATASEANFKVIFSEVSAVTGDNASSSTATIDGTDKTLGRFNFTGFTTKGEKQRATWTITNENDADLKAILAASEIEVANPEYFKATKTLSGTEIAPNGTPVTLTIEVECIKTPIDTSASVSSGDITVGITATPVAANTQAGA